MGKELCAVLGKSYHIHRGTSFLDVPISVILLYTNERPANRETIGFSDYEGVGFERVGNIGLYDGGCTFALVHGIFMDDG